MSQIKLYQVDSFTKEKFKGNPAGVITNADSLSEKQMQEIARELGNSESAFILSPDSDDHEVRIRFFTPSIEVPSCGHATIAAHYIRAVENQFESRTYNHKIGIGVLPIEVHKIESESHQGGTDYRVIMTQKKPEFLNIVERENKRELLSALNLHEEELDLRAPIQVVDTGHSKVMVGIKSRGNLNSLQPDYEKLKQLSKVIQCNGYYVFTFDSDDKEILVHGRMFAPAIGINEDPVTGNANGPLGAYIVKYKLNSFTEPEFSFNARQGEAINRAGIVNVYVEIEDGIPVKTKIGGRAVIAFCGKMEI